ncbi:MarR family transcriptional regulator [Sphaerisporangium rufum]|uniref:MarR family transcriptional regulator n=1 Tax=Sphaerisporangium rufum TaxID=1381558 RepID=A0A919R9E1_9ACTN|nr:MarR family transcriptional regulator [Sphaerisporangium rufum]GII79745.1 MarR family transcriptional regulator [Sphaerisporangium rufum]
MDETEPDVAALTRIIEDFNSVFIRLPNVRRLGFSSLSVLHTLSRQGPTRLTALTTTEQLTQPAITSLVGRLERDGLVERRPDATDRRAVLVVPTTAGLEVVRARHADRVARLGRLIAALDGEQRDAITRALPALRRVAELATSGPSPAAADETAAGEGP